MNNKITFLRHGKTQVDNATPISTWVLDEDGEKQAAHVAGLPDFQDFDVIVDSGEAKARQTDRLIAEKLGLEMIVEPQISELNRDEGGHMSSEEYERTVEQTLTHHDQSFNKWESADHARERFGAK